MNDNLNEMWTALAAYQPKADDAGHGESWAVMCRDKTGSAAVAAYKAVPHSGPVATYYSYAAVYAAAHPAETTARHGACYAQHAIDCINKAQGDVK